MAFKDRTSPFGDPEDDAPTWVPLSTEEMGDLTPEEIERLREEGIDEETDELSSRVQAAANFFMAGSYEASIRTYASIGEDAPALRGDCERQIGAALVRQGAIDEAIAHFERAKALGADPVDMDQRIADARSAAEDWQGGERYGTALLVVAVIGLIGWLFLAPLFLN